MNLFKNQKCDCLLVCGKTNRAYFYKNKLYSQLIDSIGDELQSMKIKTLSIGSEHDNFKVDNNFYGNLLNLDFYLIYQKVVFKLKNFFLNNEVNFLEKFYFNLLVKLNPKYIIAILPSVSLCISAKKLNIIVFDMQHGVIGDFENEYYSLEYRKSINQNGWPDYILTWNSNSTFWINRYLTSFTKPICIGNPFLIKFNSVEINDEYKIQYENYYQNYLEKSSIKVLLTLGYNLKKYGVNSEYGLTDDMIKTILNYPNIIWLIRMHPVSVKEVNGILSKLLKDNFDKIKDRVEWDITSEIPLPILLKKINIHLTTISATCIEASEFEIKTGMIANKNILQKLYNSEINTGKVISINDNEPDIYSFIMNFQNNSSKIHVSDFLFKNFLNNLLC